jgi:hypothetical protein
VRNSSRRRGKPLIVSLAGRLTPVNAVTLAELSPLSTRKMLNEWQLGGLAGPAVSGTIKKGQLEWSGKRPEIRGNRPFCAGLPAPPCTRHVRPMYEDMHKPCTRPWQPLSRNMKPAYWYRIHTTPLISRDGKLPLVVRFHDRPRAGAIRLRQRGGIVAQIRVPERRGQRENRPMMVDVVWLVVARHWQIRA